MSSKKIPLQIGEIYLIFSRRSRHLVVGALVGQLVGPLVGLSKEFVKKWPLAQQFRWDRLSSQQPLEGLVWRISMK